jgi:hypothetical protein
VSDAVRSASEITRLFSGYNPDLSGIGAILLPERFCLRCTDGIEAAGIHGLWS